MTPIPLHLDWVAGCFSIWGMYVVGQKKWWGWLINTFNLLLLIYINLHFSLWGFLPVNLIMMVMFCKNAVQWYRAK